jgi:hypothetical protein
MQTRKFCMRFCHAITRPQTDRSCVDHSNWFKRKRHIMKLKFHHHIIALSGLITLAACADPLDRQVQLSGPAGVNFAADQAQCRQMAQNYTDERGRQGMLLGAGVGAVAAAVEEEDLGSAIAGAAIGGLIGRAEAEAEINEDRRAVMLRCLQNKGHPVMG